MGVRGGEAGSEALGAWVTGGGGERESLVGELELPFIGGDGLGIEEVEEAAGGELRGSGKGEFGEGEELGVGGAALLVGVGE
jgi:hypothetical protein